jgi:hypothetical protein
MAPKISQTFGPIPCGCAKKGRVKQKGPVKKGRVFDMTCGNNSVQLQLQSQKIHTITKNT